MLLDLDCLKGENHGNGGYRFSRMFLGLNVNGILKSLTLYVDFSLVLWEGNCL